MFTNYTVLDLNHIHNIFTRFVRSHPRPLCTTDIVKGLVDIAEDSTSNHRWLQRSIQRLLKSWVELGIIEDLGTSTKRSSKYFRLSKYGELYVSICREKTKVDFFDNPKLLKNKSDISFRYFFVLLFAIQNSGKKFTPDDIKKYGDLNGYNISKRSWQRNLNLFVSSDVFFSQKIESTTTLSYQINNKTISMLNIQIQDFQVIEFEKNLISLGIINNFESYIDYNLLIFHILFREWMDSPNNFEYFVDQYFYKAN